MTTLATWKSAEVIHCGIATPSYPLHDSECILVGELWWYSQHQFGDKFSNQWWWGFAGNMWLVAASHKYLAASRRYCLRYVICQTLLHHRFTIKSCSVVTAVKLWHDQRAQMSNKEPRERERSECLLYNIISTSGISKPNVHISQEDQPILNQQHTTELLLINRLVSSWV